MACQPIAAFTCSSVNRSDRSCVALVENRNARSVRCFRCFSPTRPHLASSRRSPSERIARIGCGPVEGRQHALHQRREVVFESRQGSGVGRREPLRLGDVGRHVVAQVVVRAVGIQVERGTGGVHDDPSAHQPHVAPDRLTQHRQDVGAGRRAEPRRELLGVAGTAHERPALQHQGSKTRPGEREPGHQAVVPSADDDRVVRAFSHVATLEAQIVDCQPDRLTPTRSGTPSPLTTWPPFITNATSCEERDVLERVARRRR